MKLFLLVIVSFVIYKANGYADYLLIMSQQMPTLFTPSLLRTTGNENENDPSASAYSIAGTIGDNRHEYMQLDGKFQFKLIYKIDGVIQDTIIWKQSSWLTDGSPAEIIGAQMIGVPPQTYNEADGRHFVGLGLNIGSNMDSSWLDGNAESTADFWNSVGSFAFCCGEGIPAHNGNTADEYQLYILEGPILWINEQLTELQEITDDGFSGVNDRFTELEETMNDAFEGLEKTINNRFTKLEQMIRNLENSCFKDSSDDSLNFGAMGVATNIDGNTNINKQTLITVNADNFAYYILVAVLIIFVINGSIYFWCQRTKQ